MTPHVFLPLEFDGGKVSPRISSQNGCRVSRSLITFEKLLSERPETLTLHVLLPLALDGFKVSDVLIPLHHKLHGIKVSPRIIMCQNGFRVSRSLIIFEKLLSERPETLTLHVLLPLGIDGVKVINLGPEPISI